MNDDFDPASLYGYGYGPKKRWRSAEWRQRKYQQLREQLIATLGGK